MRFLSSMVIISLIALLTGCFEPTGKVKFDADKGNATFYVDGKEITNKKDGVSVVVGEHTVKAIVPLDKKWKYVGEKKFKVEKDKTTEVYVHTMKVPTEYQKEYEKKLASFDPQAYKFQLPLYLQNIDKQKLKEKIDALLAKKEYEKIDPQEIALLNYENIIENIYKQNTYPIENLEGLYRSDVDSVAVSGDKIVSGSFFNHTIKIWSLKSGKLLKTLNVHVRTVDSVAVSGDKIISGNSDDTIKIWSLKSGKLLKTLKGHRDAVYSVAVSGDKIVSGSGDDTIKIWSFKSGKLLKTLKGHRDDVSSVAVSGDKIVSGSRDDTIKIWSLKSGKLLKTLKGHRDAVYSVAVSGDKIVSGSGDDTIKIWSFKSGKLLKTLKGHKGTVNSVAVSGDKIVSGSGDDTIKIWSLKSGKLLKTLKGHRDIVNSVAVNGDKIISGCEDGTIKIWQPGLDRDNLGSINNLYYNVRHYTLPLKKLHLTIETVYKYGKIGEVYVPSVSYTSSTPQYSTITVDIQ